MLAQAFERVVALGGSRPVIVGGAAVEFYTVSGIRTGDIDIVTVADDRLASALREAGFRRPTRPGTSGREWIRDDIGLGVEIVGASLMDGNADRSRVLMVEVEGGVVGFIGIEDLIADRMGQYAADTRHGDDMIGQARALHDLAGDTDAVYLDTRIRQETLGTCDLETLKRWQPNA